MPNVALQKSESLTCPENADPNPLHIRWTPREREIIAVSVAGVHLGAAYVRIDTVEQALREVCSIDIQGEGYGSASMPPYVNIEVVCPDLREHRNPGKAVHIDNGIS